MGFRIEEGQSWVKRTQCADCGQRWWHAGNLGRRSEVIVGIEPRDYDPAGWRHDT